MKSEEVIVSSIDRPRVLVVTNFNGVQVGIE